MKEAYSEDRHLVAAVLKGDTRAFATIISNTKGLVIQIVYKMIDNAWDREDMIQEIYLKAYHKLSSFRFHSKLSTWIGSIAYNTCVNHLEKKRIDLFAMVDPEGKESLELAEKWGYANATDEADHYLSKKERIQIVEREIALLPPLFKTLITLFHKEELRYAEISKITGLPEGTLKSYLYRARKQLRDNLLKNYRKDDL